MRNLERLLTIILIIRMQRIDIKLIKPNKGQIEGVPSNPRQWKKGDVEKLARSIEQTPELFDLRPIIVYDNVDGYVAIGGNMRLAAAKHLKWKDVPCEIVSRETSTEKLKEIVIKDNGSFGEWDFDALANEWDDLDLGEWGVTGLPKLAKDEEAIERALNYDGVSERATNTNYDESKFIRKRISDELSMYAANVDVRPSIRELLDVRLAQSVIFNFDQIARFYMSDDATEDERDALRKFFLVYVTPKEAFVRGLLKIDKFTKEISASYMEGGNDAEES